MVLRNDERKYTVNIRNKVDKVLPFAPTFLTGLDGLLFPEVLLLCPEEADDTAADSEAKSLKTDASRTLLLMVPPERRLDLEADAGTSLVASILATGPGVLNTPHSLTLAGGATTIVSFPMKALDPPSKMTGLTRRAVDLLDASLSWCWVVVGLWLMDMADTEPPPPGSPDTGGGAPGLTKSLLTCCSRTSSRLTIVLTRWELAMATRDCVVAAEEDYK